MTTTTATTGKTKVNKAVEVEVEKAPDRTHVRSGPRLRSSTATISLMHLANGARYRAAFLWGYPSKELPQMTYDYKALKLYLDPSVTGTLAAGKSKFLKLATPFQVLDKVALLSPSGQLANVGVITGTIVIPAGVEAPTGIWFTAGEDVDLSTYHGDIPLAYLSLLT